MKKNTFVLGLLVAGLMVYGTGLSYAEGDLHVHGFADIIYTITDELHDVTGGKNPNENKFDAEAEVDFWKKMGDITARLDLDFGLHGDDSGAIEQARFDWSIPAGESVNLVLTGGVFNNPIGFEKQDAPDMLQITHGTIRNLLPDNLAGLMLSGGTGPVSGSLFFVNDISKADEENSIGIKISAMPTPDFELAVSYLSADDKSGPATGLTTTDEELAVLFGGEHRTFRNGDILNIVASTTVVPNLLAVVEYLDSDLGSVIGLTGNYTHGHHFLTARYEMIDPDVANSGDPTTLTVAAGCEIGESLSALLEWKTVDLDDDGTSDDTFDTVLVEFVATF